MKNNKPNPIMQAWLDFKQLFRAQVNRDIAMMSIGQQVMSALDTYNLALHAQSDGDGEGNLAPMDMSDNDCHWLEDLYVADDKNIYAITVAGGKLFRWPVIVAPDNSVTLGANQEVKPMFTASTQQAQTARIFQNAQGRYEGLAIMGSCALNKDIEIDSRRLFDCFVDRFHGGREYVNIYHLGGAKTRIGTITNIWREGNLLIGHYILDDNPVANAAGRTLAEDKKREWGGSIEFLSDDEGTPVEVAPHVVANMYTAGTLQGFSIAKAAHGAAWGTGHYLTRTPDMNKDTLAAIAQLMGNDPVALQELETWIDGENIRLAGAITRSATSTDQVVAEQTPTDQVVAEQTPVDQIAVEQTEVDQAVGSAPLNTDAPATDAAEPQIVVDEKLLAAVTNAIQNSDWWKAQTSANEQLAQRIAALEKYVADDQASETTSSEATPPPVAQPTTQVVDDLSARVGSLETAVQQMSNFYERAKPAPVKVATYVSGITPTPVKPTPALPPVEPLSVKQNVQSLWKPLNLPTRK